MTILSLDPSLTAFGWSIISNDALIDCGCIQTSKQLGSVSSSDTFRVTEIVTVLTELIEQHIVDLILFENPAGSKSSNAIKALSLVKGAVISIGVCKGIKTIPFTAKKVKKVLTNDSSASKNQIMEETCNKFPNFLTITNKWSKAKKEAASDAISIYICYLRSVDAI